MNRFTALSCGAVSTLASKYSAKDKCRPLCVALVSTYKRLFCISVAAGYCSVLNWVLFLSVSEAHQATNDSIE